MDFSRTTSLSSQGIDGRFCNINPVCRSASPNLLHDMPPMQLAERRRAQQLKLPPAGAYHKAENDEDQSGGDGGSAKSTRNQRVRQSLAGKVNQKILTSPHGIKFGGAAGLSASGQFQTGSIISCDYSGRFEKCLNRLTKAYSYVNMSDY